MGAIVAIEILVLLALSWPLPEGYRYKVVGLLAITMIYANIGERRRAIIFTPTHLIYRPPYGKPRSIALRDIVGIKRVSTIRTFGVGYLYSIGLRLSLANGETHVISTDFPEAQEIHGKIARSTGIAQPFV